jgi:Spy/CpxP family protein refolding chaperone
MLIERSLNMSRRLVHVSILSAALLAPAMVFAQDKPADSKAAGQTDRGNRGGGRGDPAQWRQQMEDRLKGDLKATDDEWKILQPKIEKVFNAQRDASGGFFGFRRGGDNNNQDEPTTPVAKALRDLRQALDNDKASADELASKLKALREAKEKAKVEVQAAQKDLKEVLTQRQEAVLVMSRMLD